LTGDVFSKKKRSEVMAAIKGHGNKSTELAFIVAARKYGLHGWARGAKGLPGKPDFIFKRSKLAVFIDGCFWHGCPRCNRRKRFHSNKAYWKQKISGNRARDRRKSRQLREMGWRVRRIWEHQLADSPVTAIARISKALK
jgi:DNA mismatch endonuclease (patch repair protein)